MVAAIGRGDHLHVERRGCMSAGILMTLLFVMFCCAMGEVVMMDSVFVERHDAVFILVVLIRSPAFSCHLSRGRRNLAWCQGVDAFVRPHCAWVCNRTLARQGQRSLRCRRLSAHDQVGVRGGHLNVAHFARVALKPFAASSQASGHAPSQASQACRLALALVCAELDSWPNHWLLRKACSDPLRSVPLAFDGIHSRRC